jgi:PAP2 superfamily
MLRRPYFFELFVVANLFLIAVIGRGTAKYLGAPFVTIIAMTVGLLPQLIAGMAVRSVVAVIRKDRSYFEAIRSREWISDTLRLLVFTALMVFTYGWIKLAVPVVHPRLLDQFLWDLDRTLFFGLSPTVFFLDLFRAPAVLRVVDWSYANIFYASMFLAFAYFLSEPRREVRVPFANGNAAMWLTAAWLYMLLPSVGPAYRFPDVWMPYQHALGKTQYLQALLMRNYQDVLRAAAGEPTRTNIRLVFGVAAFPSMHVAFQMYVFLWMRRLWTWGEVIFAVFVLAIFLGSMITGWHYLADSLFGLLMAFVAYKVTWRMKERAETLPTS